MDSFSIEADSLTPLIFYGGLQEVANHNYVLLEYSYIFVFLNIFSYCSVPNRRGQTMGTALYQGPRAEINQRPQLQP